MLMEQAYKEINVIFSNFKDDSGATDMEVKTLIIKIAGVREKILIKIAI